MNVSVNENQSSAIILVAEDADGIAYATSDDDANSFNLNTTTGVVTFSDVYCFDLDSVEPSDGAYGEDSVVSNGGSAYIFKINYDNDIEETVKLQASDNVLGDQFGYSISISEKML